MNQLDNIYLRLTGEFNRGELRAILSSGQAVVLHRLAIMSKDGDWIVREDSECLRHILSVLNSWKAHYRFGAPLDIRWMKGGWSSHFEFLVERVRVRTDFVSRPPRISERELAEMWRKNVAADVPVVDAVQLCRLKMTMREKDYPVIGELSRRMSDISLEILFSRSAGDLIRHAQANPELVRTLAAGRPLLTELTQGREHVEQLLDRERRALMREDEKRLERYQRAAEPWQKAWPILRKQVENLDLLSAHEVITAEGAKILPFLV